MICLGIFLPLNIVFIMPFLFAQPFSVSINRAGIYLGGSTPESPIVDNTKPAQWQNHYQLWRRSVCLQRMPGNGFRRNYGEPAAEDEKRTKSKKIACSSIGQKENGSQRWNRED